MPLDLARPQAARAPQTVALAPPVGGWHWAEWCCELVGTVLLLVGGLSAICLDFGAGSAMITVVPSHSARLLLTGLLFSGTGALVTISPIGRRSGAHLNPAVTVGFWCRHRVHWNDLVGYITSQCAGAFVGAAAVKWWWGATARSVDLGVTAPGLGMASPVAAGIEAGMTALLVGTILLMLSWKVTARWTPLAVWLLVAGLVWQGARWTGTSLNPARSLAPAVLAPHLAHLWVYLCGPLVGALLAAAFVRALPPQIEPLTAKLFHDQRYQSSLGSRLPIPRRR